MINVLITSASRKVWLVRSFQRAMEEVSPGGRIIAGDMNPNSAALYMADEGCILPPTNNDQFLSVLLELCRNKQIGLIVPTRDEELIFYSSHLKQLRDSGILVAVPKLDILKKCQDKRAFTEFCDIFGFERPQYIPEVLWDRTDFYPMFFRPRFGKRTGPGFKIETKTQLMAALEMDSQGLVQEFIKGPEYTVDLFADFESKVISAVPRERIAVLGGECFVARTVAMPEVVKQCQRLALELALVCHNTIQCFVKSGKPVFIEVNPRFGGASNVSIVAGANTPRYLLEIALGRTLQPQIGMFNSELTMLRYTEDIFLSGDKHIRPPF